MAPQTPTPPDDALVRFCASSGAALVAETCTLPIDVAKTRLQVQQAEAEYTGMVDCWRHIVRDEGAAACWKGLAPALVRQVCYSSLSLVLYEPIRKVLTPGDGEATFLQRLLAGGTAGALAITVFNPTEVLKTKMQTSRGSVTPSMASVLARVYRLDGLPGFWAGLQPNVARTFLVNAAELGTYDEAKQRLIPHLGDNPAAHIGASGIAGVASACTSTPADVVKTRLMNSAGGGAQYKGVVDAFVTIAREEGLGALYKGFSPIVVRKVVWCTIFFVSYEKSRALINSAVAPPRK